MSKDTRVEIIDCALLVIDINKGPQVQTGEHLIMIESLDIKNVIDSSKKEPKKCI